MANHLVMVVDDDPDTCAAMVELLEHSGYDTLTARNGLQALKQLRSPRKPHVILIDLQMPGMGGEALCKACDSVPDLAGIPRWSSRAARSSRPSSAWRARGWRSR